MSILATFLASSPEMNAAEWSGEVAAEATLFTESAQFSDQEENLNLAVSAQPEFYHSWDNRNQSFEFVPFVRVDKHDTERTHVDIRELAWTGVYDHWEVRAGISRVFWGVAEFQHLVDVINQVDLVENIDGEDRLGQPMLLLTSIRDWGSIELFLLPYFRERTFAGEEGRLRSPFVVDNERAEYESSAEAAHVDVALRYEHYVGDWDFSLSHFSGTNREPLLTPFIEADGSARLAPFYQQMEQTAVTLQATKGRTLWKLEALHRVTSLEVHNAIASGVEYSFFGIADTSLDLGLLLEYHYDDRGENAPTVFEDDIAIGGRLAFNDTQTTELLAGAVIDQSTGGVFFSLEGSRRLTNQLLLNIESRIFFNQDEEDIAFSLDQDDYFRVNLSFNF